MWNIIKKKTTKPVDGVLELESSVDEELKTKVNLMDSAITNLQKRLRNLEDSFAESEHDHSIIKQDVSDIRSKLDTSLELLKRLDSLVASNCSNSASKEDVNHVINSLLVTLTQVKEKINLPF